MSKNQRIAYFFVVSIVIFLLYIATTSNHRNPSEIDVVIYASLIMMVFVASFLEHYFTKPTDVIASTISILLLLLPLHGTMNKLGTWYWIIICYNLILLSTALLSLLLVSRDNSSNNLANRAAAFLKQLSTQLGSGRWLYFLVFFATIIFYVDSQSYKFIMLALFSALVLAVDPKSMIMLALTSGRKHSDDIGEIIGVQSKNIFLAKLHKKRVPVKRFDTVKFQYSMDSDGKIYTGIVYDNYLLNEQQWVKIYLLKTDLPESSGERLTPNVVYKSDPTIMKIKDNLIGIVIENSKINRVRFEYVGKHLVQEGDLLEIAIGEEKILYQIVQGVTSVEMLESKNETGTIIGEAIQLGTWRKDSFCFERYGWVPQICTPVVKPCCEPHDTYGPTEDVQIGIIPSTDYPVLINLETAISHHMAVLGVTGTGKSVFSRFLIKQMMEKGFKVICIDFTNEYKLKFDPGQCYELFAEPVREQIFCNLDNISLELEKFPNQQDKAKINKSEKEIRGNFSEAISSFLQSDKFIAVFELPDVSNSYSILEYTKWFFMVLFQIAKNEDNHGQRVCVVLEEAHTIIPEWSFVGTDSKKAQSLVNSIGQIALQGRKYRIGFLVIAQRTANVSKTVLTQCNTIIAFQQFDKTSFDFLANYVGHELTETLSFLKPRHAIAVGKALRSKSPVIFHVPDLDEQ